MAAGMVASATLLARKKCKQRRPSVQTSDDPAPQWASQDVGTVGAAGSVSASTSGSDTTYTVSGSGADVWSSADEFHFAHQRVGGDATITARIASQENTHAWAKAGVMIRDSLSAGSKNALVALSPDNGLVFQRRPQAGGSSQYTAAGSASTPVWVRLERRGNTLTAFRSPDGQSWSEIGSATVPMGDSLYAGMAVTSHNDGTLSEATFTDVSLDTTATTPPDDDPVPPWASQDVGAVGAEGSLSASTSGGDTTYTVSGSGADVWSSADEFHFAHQRVGGDVTITARIASQENTHAWAKAGVMIRDSLSAGSKNALVALSPDNGLVFQRRPQAGGSSQYTAAGSASTPVWVRLERRGNTLTAFRSPDGQSWSEIGSATVPMGDSLYAGMAVTSHNDGTLSEATFTDVSLDTTTTTPPDDDPVPLWASQDVGAVGAAGSLSASTSGGDTTYTVSGSGADVWSSADEFHFAHQRVGGDATITARIASQENTHAWAKAGVMLRDSLSAGSKNALVALSPDNGLVFQRRPQPGGSSQYTAAGSASTPVWVRLERRGNTLTAFRSPDGQSWSKIGSATVPMGDSLYAGMAVTSHNDGTLSEATFTDVSLDTTATTPPDDSVIFATNAGGAPHTTGGGTTYQADTLFSGGQTTQTSSAIAGTQEDALYQSARSGAFSYAIPVPESGDYEVTLRFAETNWQSSGQRVFDVGAEGQEVVTDLDVYGEAGTDAAYDVTRTVSVTDGTLDLAFNPDVDNATVSAIAVRPRP